MPRLSITLTESQAAALDRIAAETGATKQSMIGLAISAWIRANDYPPARDPEAQHHAVCEVCGEPATNGTVGPDGAHVYCEKHRPPLEEWEWED